MLGLAIHTSSPQLGLMLQSIKADDANPVKRHQVWDLGREVSSHFHVKLLEFMQPYDWQDISFVAVAKGPGGFTGTRIGVVAARTLAQQLEVPLFGVSSLAAIAAKAISQVSLDAPPERDILPEIAIAMPAKREAVYSAIYRSQSHDLTEVLAEAVRPEPEWAQIAEKYDCAQDNCAIRLVTTSAGEGIADSVTGVMTLALARWAQGQRPLWSSVMPFYGQHPVHR